MTTDLVFEKIEGEKWSCTFPSEGNSVVEVEREQAGSVIVYASLEGMREVDVLNFANARKDTIFQLEIPVGVTVRIESAKEVTKAKIMTE